MYYENAFPLTVCHSFISMAPNSNSFKYLKRLIMVASNQARDGETGKSGDTKGLYIEDFFLQKKMINSCSRTKLLLRFNQCSCLYHQYRSYMCYKTDRLRGAHRSHKQNRNSLSETQKPYFNTVWYVWESGGTAPRVFHLGARWK
jgi:hypothetical protein